MSNEIPDNGSEWLGGLHAVKSVLKANPAGVELLVVQKGRRDPRLRDVLSLAEKSGIRIEEKPKSELEALLGRREHQGVLALCAGQQVGNETELMALVATVTEPLLILVLDGITDPHNLGACLRSADAAGVHAVVTPADNSVGITPTVRKVAVGAADSVPVFRVSNLQRALSKLKAADVWVYGAAGEADALVYGIDWKGHCAVVMGSEGRGLRRLTREACDQLFSIPMQGTVSSLNVSVATGVTLFEIARQRQHSLPPN